MTLREEVEMAIWDCLNIRDHKGLTGSTTQAIDRVADILDRTGAPAYIRVAKDLRGEWVEGGGAVKPYPLKAVASSMDSTHSLLISEEDMARIMDGLNDAKNGNIKDSPVGEVAERMAKAAYEDWISDVRDLEESWEDLPQSHRDRLVKSQEAALSAVNFQKEIRND